MIEYIYYTAGKRMSVLFKQERKEYNAASTLLLSSLNKFKATNGYYPKYARCEIITFALIGKYTGAFYGVEKLWKFEWRD